jgi:5-(carboxyamino)imidazole ribonucleotide synthase
MINLIGSMPERRSALAGPHIHVHDYGKMPRPGRKLGHVTVVADDDANRDVLLEHVSKLLII